MNQLKGGYKLSSFTVPASRWLSVGHCEPCPDSWP